MININTIFKKENKKLFLFGSILICVVILAVGIKVFKDKKDYYTASAPEYLAEDEDDNENEEADAEEEVAEENTIQETPQVVPEVKQEEGPKPQEAKEATQNTGKQKAAAQKPQENQSFAANLQASKQTSQLIIVSGNGGSSATVSMHSKINGLWKQQFSVEGHVGIHGMTANKREGDGKTPIGVFGFGQAFGVNGNPGTSLSYKKVDGNDYWVDDTNSPHYNQFVNTASVQKDWNSAEHIVDHAEDYAYAVNINYNSGCTPGKGSAIFLHCSTGGGTAGCVSIPRGTMVNVLNSIQSGCLIVIAPSSNISNY